MGLRLCGEVVVLLDNHWTRIKDNSGVVGVGKKKLKVGASPWLAGRTSVQARDSTRDGCFV